MRVSRLCAARWRNSAETGTQPGGADQKERGSMRGLPDCLGPATSRFNVTTLLVAGSVTTSTLASSSLAEKL
jgi:hypothetical protein